MADAGTFALSARALARLRPQILERVAEAQPTLLRGLRSGWAEVRSRRWVQAFLALLCAYHVVVLIALAALAVPAVRETRRGAPEPVIAWPGGLTPPRAESGWPS